MKKKNLNGPKLFDRSAYVFAHRKGSRGLMDRELDL